MKHILAVIPARKGSKGLRHKNLRKVGGVPLLVHAIALAHASARRGEKWSNIVSTDSAHYARLARRAGAIVPGLRPRELATDTARVIDTVLFVLRNHLQTGNPVDAVVMLSATTPLTQPRDVRRALRLFEANRGASVVSVTAHGVPESWCFDLVNGRLHARSSQRVDRRQTAGAPWVLNGAVYVAQPRWLVRYRRFLVSGKTAALAMPKERSVDIEDRWDLCWAEYLWNRRQNTLR